MTPYQLEMPPSDSNPNGNRIIQTNQSIVILGANGSGKTRLGVWLEEQNRAKIHRISAQKSLSIPQYINATSAELAEKWLTYGLQPQELIQQTHNEQYLESLRNQRRWGNKPATHFLSDFDSLLSLLFSEHNDKTSKYADEMERYFKFEVLKESIPQQPPQTYLNKLKLIWEEVLPERKLIIGGNQINAQSSNTNYDASEMSDGERVIFYLIGQILTRKMNSTVVIDEPELHINKSTLNLLWNKLEIERSDCLFVYITHDVDFATSRNGAVKICLIKYEKIDSYETWDWYQVPEPNSFPEDLLLRLIGSRQPILFVEGTKGSLDYQIYQKLYPEFNVTPLSSFKNVINATVSFSSLNKLHRIESFGIVDRDYRDDARIKGLESISNIRVLEFAEIENLLITESLLRVIAQKLNFVDIEEVIGKSHQIVFSEIIKNREGLICEIVRRQTQQRLENFNEKVKTKIELEKAYEDFIGSIVLENELTLVDGLIEKILSERDYLKALKIYKNKGLVAQIANNAFNLGDKRFINFIFGELSKGEEVFRELKRIVPQF